MKQSVCGVVKLFLILQLLTGVVNSQSSVPKLEDGWKGLRIFESTEHDVVKLFGKGENVSGLLGTIYNHGSERILVDYAGIPCSDLNSFPNSFTVAKGTILMMAVHFRDPVPMSQIAFLRDQYESVSGRHSPNNRNYYYKKRGIYLETILKDDIESLASIHYWPNAEIERTFGCKK